MTENHNTSTPTRILMVLDAPYPHDIRVWKEAGSLITAGFEVHLLCTKRPGESSFEEVEGLKVHRVEVSALAKKKGWRDIYISLFHRSPWHLKALQGLCDKINPHWLHNHDLPLAGVVNKVARERKIRWALDLHENYPEAIMTWFSWRKSPLIRIKNKLIHRYPAWLHFENRMCHAANVVIAVVDEMKERICEVHELPPEKVVVVSNTETKTVGRIYDQAARPEFLNPETFNISYVGGLGPHRGIDTAVLAMPSIVRQVPNAILHIVGGGHPDVVNHLKDLAKSAAAENSVKFHGHVSMELVRGTMKFSDVNIIPHHSNEHTDCGVPHKLFQAIASGVPTLVSDSAPLKRFISALGGTTIFRAGEPNSFAEVAVKIAQNQEYYNKQAQQMAAALVHSPYTWEASAEVLVNMYREER